MKYQLVRQDDNGQQFVVARDGNLETLERLMKHYDGKFHKNIYWIEEISDRKPLFTK